MRKILKSCSIVVILCFCLRTFSSNIIPSGGNGGGTTFTAGNGLSLDSGILSVNPDGTTIVFNGASQLVATGGSNPMTTKGDIITYNGTSETRLGIGSSGQVLTVSGSSLLYQTPASQGITQLTGDVAAGPGSGQQVSTIQSGVVTNSKMASMANNAVKGNISGSFGAVNDVLLGNLSVPSFLSIANGNNILVGSSGSSITLSGVALPIANGGTGQLTATNAFNALSPLTTIGDVITYNGTSNVRLGIGSSGQVITVSGSSLIYQTPSTSSGVTQIATLDGNISSANGATISGTSLYMQSGSSTIAGLVNSAAQTFGGGAKTFAYSPIISPLATNKFVVTDGASRLSTKTIAASDLPALPYLPLAGGSLTGNVSMQNNRLVGIATPTAAGLSGDAIPKSYVDALNIEPSVVCTNKPTDPIAAAIYNNGTNGVGATLTGSPNGVLTLDGVTPPVGARVLFTFSVPIMVPHSGIYTVTTQGTGSTPWVATRATNYDEAPSEIKPGDLVVINQGGTYANAIFIQSGLVNTVGTDAIIFTQYGLDTVGTIDSQTQTANAAVFSGNSLYMQSGASTFPGVVNTSAQVFGGGQKSFSFSPLIQPLATSSIVETDSTSTLTTVTKVPINQGGTNNTTALINGRIIVSGGGSLGESGSSLPLQALWGGTGFTSYSLGDMLFANSTNLSKLSIGSSGKILTANTNGPIWQTNTAAAGAGVSQLATIDGIIPSIANGAVINGTSLYLQSGSSTVPGLLNLSSQNIKGPKTIQDPLNLLSYIGEQVQPPPATPNSGIVDIYVKNDGILYSKASNGIENQYQTGLLMNQTAGGRLTLLSGTPITSTDQTNISNVYYTPYVSNKIALYDGTNWTVQTFTDANLPLTITSGKNYDVYAYWNGILKLELSAAWTDDVTKGTVIEVVQDGVWVKSSDATRRWVGTIRGSAANKTTDSAASRLVWNLQNQVQRFFSATDPTVSWSYSTSAYRAADANTTVGQGRVEMVQGQDPGNYANVQMTYFQQYGAVSNSLGIVGCANGVGISSQTVNSAISYGGAGSATAIVPLTATYYGFPGVGYHYIQSLENANATGVTTWYGAASPLQTGLTGYAWQ